MELTTKSYKKINDFINKSNNDNNLEFELRFTKKILVINYLKIFLIN